MKRMEIILNFYDSKYCGNSARINFSSNALSGKLGFMLIFLVGEQTTSNTHPGDTFMAAKFQFTTCFE